MQNYGKVGVGGDDLARLPSPKADYVVYEDY
jgi:hypothetical protein